MKHRAHQVCAYVPRPPLRDRYAHAARVILLAVLAVFLVMLVTGCSKRPEVVAAEKKERAGADVYPVTIYRDYKTGCEYVSGVVSTITPRIAADGKTHMGCKGAAQ